MSLLELRVKYCLKCCLLALCLLVYASACTWLKPSDIHNIESLRMEEGLPPIKELKALGGQAAEIIAIFDADGSSAKSGAASYRAIAVFKSGKVALLAPPGPSAYGLLELGKGLKSLAYFEPRALLASASDAFVSVYSLNRRTLMAKIPISATRVSSLSFAADGKSLLVGGFDGRVYLWNFSEQDSQSEQADLGREYLEGYIGQSSVVSAIAPHPEGRVIFSGGWQGEIFAWLTYASLGARNTERNAAGSRFFADSATNMVAYRDDHMAVDFLKVSPDGEHFVVGTQSGWIELWDVRGFRKLAAVQAHSGLIYDLAISPSWRTVASVGRDGQIVTHSLVPPKDDRSDWQFERSSQIEADGVRKLTFVAERKLILGGAAGALNEKLF